MGALLACGVYGASSLRSLQSRLPFMVSPPFHVSVVLHLLLRWGGLVTGLWPLLLLLRVGLLWGLCCAVMSPWPMVAPSPVVSRLGFFLWRLFGLGLVGCGPAWVPAFFLGGGGTLLPLSWSFLLGSSNFLQFGCPGSLSFLELFTGVLSSRFQYLLIARGGCG